MKDERDQFDPFRDGNNGSGGGGFYDAPKDGQGGNGTFYGPHYFSVVYSVGWGQQVPRRNNPALGDLIFGILGIVLGSILLGVVAVVLANSARRQTGRMSGVALAALICGIVAIVYSVILIIILFRAYAGSFTDEAAGYVMRYLMK